MWMDPVFRRHPGRYIFQCTLAVATMLLVIGGLKVILNAALLASLGSTVFLVFAMPHVRFSHTTHLLGGYAVGLAVGMTVWWLEKTLLLNDPQGLIGVWTIVFTALAVGLSMLVMVVTNTDHPPAVGLTVGLLIDNWDWRTIVVIVGSLIALVMIRRLLRNRLINL
jgi:CBS-domain-containing membrane protein